MGPPRIYTNDEPQPLTLGRLAWYYEGISTLEHHRIYDQFVDDPFWHRHVAVISINEAKNLGLNMADQPEYLVTGLPNPKVDHASWLIAMYKYDKAVSLIDYQQGAMTSETALDMLEISRRITMANRDEITYAEMLPVKGEQINHYKFRDEAKGFWANAIEQGMTPQEILDAWRAMQTIAEEVKGDKDGEK